jgi:hypothetical protein
MGITAEAQGFSGLGSNRAKFRRDQDHFKWGVGGRVTLTSLTTWSSCNLYQRHSKHTDLVNNKIPPSWNIEEVQVE